MDADLIEELGLVPVESVAGLSAEELEIVGRLAKGGWPIFRVTQMGPLVSVVLESPTYERIHVHGSSTLWCLRTALDAAHRIYRAARKRGVST